MNECDQLDMRCIPGCVGEWGTCTDLGCVNILKGEGIMHGRKVESKINKNIELLSIKRHNTCAQIPVTMAIVNTSPPVVNASSLIP